MLLGQKFYRVNDTPYKKGKKAGISPNPLAFKEKADGWFLLLLMAEILHQFIGSLSHYF